MSHTPVVGLLRVSTAAQAGEDRQGLPAQREACERIARNYGLLVTQWVELPGVSGAAVLDDSRFVAMLEHVRSGGVRGVVCAELDRLFRRGRFADFAILDAFVDAGAVLYTNEGTFDPSQDGGALTALLKGELSGQERRRIIDRTRRGRERIRRERGIRAEGAVGMPRGVQFDHQTGSWSYVYPVAELVREVFRLWVTTDGTLPYSEISSRTGLAVGTQNRSWAVRNVLTQPLYKGVYRVDRTWHNGKPTPRAPEDCYEHVVLDPPLIDPVEWQRAQELVAAKNPSRAPRRNPDDQDGIYAGVLDCAVCPELTHLHVHPGGWRRRKGQRLWQHAGYTCRTTGCPTGFTSIRLADPAIDAVLEDRLGSPEVLEALIDEALREHDTRADHVPTEVTRQLTQLENHRTRVKDAYVSGDFGLDEMRKRIDAIDAERNALEALQTRAQAPVEVDAGTVGSR